MTIINKETGPKSLGIYIHIPFCKRKCRYCDFCSYPVTDPEIHLSYIMKVIYELRAKRALLAESVKCGGSAPPVDTIYIGGGTPSVIEAGFIVELMDAVYTTFLVDDDAEITIEINPGTADTEKMRRYRSAGINRISIGAQSFDDRLLGFLGRAHNGDDILRCVSEAFEAGFENIGLDMIFGIPAQTQEGFEKDLNTALSLSPSHLSLYGLQIEQDTPLHKDWLEGVFDVIDDLEDRQMYHRSKEIIKNHGLVQYEISNSALPGKESRHNLKYWSLEPYAGFGLSSHSYIGGKRFSNTAVLSAYLAADDEKEMTESTHENTESDDMSEFIFLGLRRISGIDLSWFNGRFGKDFWELYGEETENLIGQGLLERSGDILRLTSLGLDLANVVFREYV